MDKILTVVKHHLDLVEKQVRLLTELADNAPVMSKEEVGPEQFHFIIVHRERMREIVRQLKSEVEMTRFGVETALGERETPLLDGMIRDS